MLAAAAELSNILRWSDLAGGEGLEPIHHLGQIAG